MLIIRRDFGRRLPPCTSSTLLQIQGFAGTERQKGVYLAMRAALPDPQTVIPLYKTQEIIDCALVLSRRH